jgi:recombinational DNA repair protein (RecF pathway)
MNEEDEPIGMSDTDRIELAQGGQPQGKFCALCGTNVAGKKRYKDSRGYICRSCAKEERRAEIEGTKKCAECGRRVKPAGLVEYNGARICKKCHADHLEKHKFTRKVATHHMEEHEKKRVIVLAIIFGILAIFVIIGMFR